jgi:type IV pilus assembly protein PilV
MHTPNNLQRDQGFTLVEVLVSLVILSIGLLGMAKLVLVSSHSNDSAYLRSQATVLAYEILDKMRANVTAAVATNYDTLLNVVPAPPIPLCNTAGACTTQQQVAAYDVYIWKQHLNAATPACAASCYGALPDGKGQVTTVGTTTTIIVQWDDAAAQSAFVPGTAGVQALMQITLQSVLQ